VVGVVLLVGIVLLLASVATVVFLDLAQEREPSPDVTLAAESSGVPGAMRLVHEGGDTLDGDDIEIRGVADPDGMAGTRFVASDRHAVVPTSETVAVVWEGEHGTSYVLWEFDVDPSAVVPPPDQGCDWVDSETSGGTEDAKVDGLVVDCDVRTDKVVEVQNGGVVIGDVESDVKTVDADNASLYGDVTAENDVNVQNGTVSGTVTSAAENVKLDAGTSTGGAVDATKTAEVLGDSTAGGDVVGDDLVKVFDSTVEGSVATTGSGQVKLDNATVTGDVYVDDADFDCTDSTIDGQDCSEYDPEDPGDY